MPPRKTTDFGALFESLIEDLRIQLAASVERNLSEFSKRLARLERRLDQLDPTNTAPETIRNKRICSLCDRSAVARGLCSAHYQQWRYRERKTSLTERVREMNENTAFPDASVIDSAVLLDNVTHIHQDN
jgi:hypothetical protein